MQDINPKAVLIFEELGALQLRILTMARLWEILICPVCLSPDCKEV